MFVEVWLTCYCYSTTVCYCYWTAVCRNSTTIDCPTRYYWWWIHVQLLTNYWSGLVVSTLALINKVNQHRAQLVLAWVTISGFSSK